MGETRRLRFQGLTKTHRLKSVLPNPYWQPQEFGVQAHPLAADAALSELFPFADLAVLKTESCSVWRLLAHFGHSICWPADITMRS